jgi:pectin methylesterase-like acyl-CoA thioesterase
MLLCTHHTTECHNPDHNKNPRTHGEISHVCVCVCVCVHARADSVICDKSVSLLGHQHTLFQDKTLITYYLLQMLNFRIYMKNTHLFQEVKEFSKR